MATSFNLQEYILFRTEIKRELTNSEVDTNFKMVANPWETNRVYEIGNIVYHPVIVDDPTTTGEDQVLAWWRANVRTTQGVFDTSQWDMIGGIGSGNINIQGTNSFGKINVNSTIATGSLQAGNDAIITSTTPNDTFNLIAGQGMQLQYNLATKAIVLVNTLATNPGEVNVGENIGIGATHQDIYAGKSGVNLQFFGLDSTNTGSGAALSVSTDSTLKNVVYNFNEGLVDLAQLNSGAPKISMLSDVSTVPPTANQILQYNAGSGLWTPVALSSLGNTNIYGQDGTVASSTRILSLNGSAGQLQFNRLSDANTGVHFDNTSNKHQFQLRNSAATGVAAQSYSLNNITKAISGVFGNDGSFGIDMSDVLGGLSVDALSISTNNELYVPEIASSSLQAAGAAYRIPLVNTGTTGRFESSANYDVANFTDQAGSVDMIGVRHKGTYELTGVSGQNVSLAISADIDSEHDFASNASLGDGYGIRMTYKTPNVTEGVNIAQWLAKSKTTYYGWHLQTTNNAATDATKYVGSNISLDNKTGVALNVGQIIGFNGSGVNPQRVGLYSNVVDTQPNSSGGTILTQLIADSGTWAGYFVGCVNIDKGGLVLPSTTFANRPLCNDVSGGTISDRTLWINSANGHLYRGTKDIEASGGGGGSSTLAGLSDVNLSGLSDDQLLVYNSSTGVWENATLAPYNLNAISLTGGGVSIQLSDGSASSDVDLLPGTNITFSVNEATDEITINSTGGGGGSIGATGVQGAIGKTGATGVGFTGATGAGFTGATGAQGAIGKTGATGAGLTGATGVAGQQGSIGKTGATGTQGPVGGGIGVFFEARVISQTGSGQPPSPGSITAGQLLLEQHQAAQPAGSVNLATQGLESIGISSDNYSDVGLGTLVTNGFDSILNSIQANWSSWAIGDNVAKFVFNNKAQTATWTLGIKKDNVSFTNLNSYTSGDGLGAYLGGQTSPATNFNFYTINASGTISDGEAIELTTYAIYGYSGAVGKTGATGAGLTGATGAGFTGATGVTGQQGASGQQGAIGKTGATGAGFTGATGVTGQQGAISKTGATGAGFTGATGAAGQQGANGQQGAIGKQGATGVAGQQGASGQQGAIGKTGATGAGFTGATGAAGQQGANGQQGAIGKQGATGVAGASGQQGAIGKQGATGVAGEQGAVGKQGATGEQGAIGRQGATGADGKQGATGSAGKQGATGAAGQQGAIGEQGAIGKTGETGQQGAIGKQGATGVTGQQGAIGKQGATGVKGAQGDTGNQGATGVTGAQGAQGEQGATGQQGAVGKIGLQGATGAQGKAGATGEQGAVGKQGAAGNQGATGAQGAAGVQGATGITGPQGDTGVGKTGLQGATGQQGAIGPQGPQGASLLGATGATGSGTSSLWTDPTIILNIGQQIVPANGTGSAVDTPLYGVQYVDDSTLGNGLEHDDSFGVGAGKTDSIVNGTGITMTAVEVWFSVHIETPSPLPGGSARLNIVNAANSSVIIEDAEVGYVAGAGQGRWYTGRFITNFKASDGVGIEIRNPNGNPAINVNEFNISARRFVATLNTPT